MATAAEPTPSVISTSLLVVSAVFPALSLLSIVLRWISRNKLKSGWRSDDWMIVVTWIVTFPMSIDIWAFVPHVGINNAKEPLRQSAMNSSKCLWSATLFMTVSLAIVKISVLLFYKRIFVTPRFTIVIWVLIALISSWGIITTVLHAVQADPISTIWTGIGTLRFDAVAFSKARAGTSLALDIIVLLLPAQKIANLHLSPKKKLSVALIFGLGGFCCIAAAVRLALVIQTIPAAIKLKEAASLRVSRTSRGVIWSIIEPNCSIIAACLPCYGPFFHGGRAPKSSQTDRSKMYSHGQRKTGEINESEIELSHREQSTGKDRSSHQGWEEDMNGPYLAYPDHTVKSSS